MPTAHLPGVDLHYEVEGSGPPVVLIAGAVSDSASWGPLVPLLAAHFTVIRPDNRLAGRTRMTSDGDVTLADWAGDIIALTDHLGIDRPHLVGHSLGGLIALAASDAAPDRVASLTLLSSAPMRLSRNTALFNTLLALRAEGQPPDLWLRAFFPWLFHPRFFDTPDGVEEAIRQSLAYPHAQPVAAMARQVAAMVQIDTEGLGSATACPALALLAADDLLIPGQTARAALAQVPGIRIETVAEAGHSIHWDAPDSVAEHVISFITGGRG
ncbi:MAG: alpha/beta fold hydrolase [Flavimaricola sp.]|nr:alpha/beta fold hydrolase [Flavimaricola sp.]